MLGPRAKTQLEAPILHRAGVCRESGPRINRERALEPGVGASMEAVADLPATLGVPPGSTPCARSHAQPVVPTWL